MAIKNIGKWKEGIADDLSGSGLYLIRARAAFPILVRQAKASVSINYGDLASELKMKNARNLNYVLGAIGAVVERLGNRFPDLKIPALTGIVISKTTGLPGDGIDWFMPKDDFKKKNLLEKRKTVDRMLDEVYSFEKWDWVLAQFGFDPLPGYNPNVQDREAHIGGRGGVESEDHIWLKKFIAQNPDKVGLKKRAKPNVEYLLLSSDKIDVCFSQGEELIGVEVKSFISEENDIRRGLFQCVKYQALLEAEQRVRGERLNCRAILVVQRTFPQSLIPIKNLLGIEVFFVEDRRG